MKIEIDETEYMQGLFMGQKYNLIKKAFETFNTVRAQTFLMAELMEKVFNAKTPAELDKIRLGYRVWKL